MNELVLVVSWMIAFFTKDKCNNTQSLVLSSLSYAVFPFYPITSTLAPSCFENQHHGDSSSVVGNQNENRVGDRDKTESVHQERGTNVGVFFSVVTLKILSSAASSLVPYPQVAKVRIVSPSSLSPYPEGSSCLSASSSLSLYPQGFKVMVASSLSPYSQGAKARKRIHPQGGSCLSKRRKILSFKVNLGQVRKLVQVKRLM